MALVYHITHMKNLAGIVAADGLCCDRIREERQVHSVKIAHQHIKDRRKRRAVKSLAGKAVAAGGNLCDYVPFYFAPRSPMLYAIDKGNVEGYQEGQNPIVHLVTSTENLQSMNRPIAFTNGHAEIDYTEFSEDLSQLDKLVDWTIMASTYWNETLEHPDRKRKRQAEFLVHEFVPWTTIELIGVIDKRVAEEITTALENSSHRPLVVVERAWYF